MKIISVVGARPQFVKLAPLSRKIRGKFREIIVHTGQHFDANMSGKFFDELKIAVPDYNLNAGSGSHAFQTARILEGIEGIFIEEKPDLVIVFGDTNSTLAGAVAASKLNIQLLHIEAGLRSFNRQMPEEINRIVTDHVSNHLFAPTKIALENLEKEGLKSRSFLTGDIMVDSLQENIKIARTESRILDKLDLNNEEFYLLTLHRPYNVDNIQILSSILEKLSNAGKKIVFPVHPRTSGIIEKHKILFSENIKLTEPLGYLDFLNLESNSSMILTDSGGIQKEAFILKKPCVTLRSETEWIETVEEGWNILANPGTDDILKAITEFRTPQSQSNIFGISVADGMTKLIEELLSSK